MSETFLHVMGADKNWEQRLKRKGAPTKVDIPRGYGRKMTEDRWKVIHKNNDKYKEQLEADGGNDGLSSFKKSAMEELLDDDTLARCDLYKDNIENFIGTVKVPVGIAGPVRVNGLHAQGDYFIPLATTEAALVASINRGISVINQSGGASAVVLVEGVNRDPVIIFKSLIEVGKFLHWSNAQFDKYKSIAESTTRHGKLVRVNHLVEGNHIHMRCTYTSGDASGQNMVTIATEAIIEYIEEHSPVKPVNIFLEGGMSGDKKANSAVYLDGRGKKVVAEVVIPRSVIETTLHASPEQLANNSNAGIRGLIMRGSLAFNCHFSNPITALAIATGQDPACAAESHVGLARCEVTPEGDLYVSVTLPNVLVATVGGGTKLPSQRACLELMGLYGKGKANALAEVMAAICIAGELSLGAAIISGDFAKAHKILARDTSEPIDLSKDTLSEAFVKAQAALIKLSNLPGKDVILNIYGLYKQATVGDINIEKPSFFSWDLKAKAKYDAWSKKKGLTKDQAMRAYVELVQELILQDEQSKSK